MWSWIDKDPQLERKKKKKSKDVETMEAVVDDNAMDVDPQRMCTFDYIICKE